MTTLVHPVDAPPATGPDRGTAALAGALYLLTFLTSIPTLALYAAVHDRTDFVLGGGATTGVLWGGLLEVCLAVSCVGTAVVLFPVLRRHSEHGALGFLAARLLEGALILLGVVAVLAVLTLRGDATLPARSGSGALITAGRALVTVHDGTFLLGQSLMPVVNALCLGSVLYRSGLVPRVIPTIGLLGAPLLLASDVAIFCGVFQQGTPLAGLAALPVAGWELALGLWLLLKGFRPAS